MNLPFESRRGLLGDCDRVLFRAMLSSFPLLCRCMRAGQIIELGLCYPCAKATAIASEICVSRRELGQMECDYAECQGCGHVTDKFCDQCGDCVAVCCRCEPQDYKHEGEMRD